MVDLSPFTPKSEEWVDELISLREQRKKIEKREKKLQGRLLTYMKNENEPIVRGTEYEAKRKATEWRGLPRESLSLGKIKTNVTITAGRTEEQVKADIKRVFG